MGGVSDRGVYICTRNPDNTVTRKYRPGCYLNNRLYTAGQSWVVGQGQVTCTSVGNGHYAAKAAGRLAIGRNRPSVHTVVLFQVAF